MSEFELSGHAYRAAKLTATQQFHLSRKLAPLIPKLIPIGLQASQGGVLTSILSNPQVLQPFADALAEMPDAAAEYVLNTCLSVVRRKQGENWAAVWSPSAQAAMFEDLNDIGRCLPIVLRVIQDSLGPFIAGLLTSQPTTDQTPA